MDFPTRAGDVIRRPPKYAAKQRTTTCRLEHPAHRNRSKFETAIAIVAGQQVSSPRLRGCSGGRRRVELEHDVVPAPAGLFRGGSAGRRSGRCRPRACGAVPTCARTVSGAFRSSPRLRGCSLVHGLRVQGESVVPAPAGLFRSAIRSAGLGVRRPRACGAVPCVRVSSSYCGWSSPRLRGCSSHKRVQVDGQRVVPAPAGLFPVARR